MKLLPQVERLQGTITKLKAENVEYRNNNKTQQFEASIQELQQKLQQTGTFLKQRCLSFSALTMLPSWQHGMYLFPPATEDRLGLIKHTFEQHVYC